MDEMNKDEMEGLANEILAAEALRRLCLGVKLDEAVELSFDLMMPVSRLGDGGELHGTEQFVPCHVKMFVRLKKVKGRSVQLLFEAPTCVQIVRRGVLGGSSSTNTSCRSRAG